MTTPTNIQQDGVKQQGSDGQLDALVIRPLYDLIYCGIDEAGKLLEAYPEAKTEDASDIVHEDRFGIHVTDSLKNYLKNVIKLGLGTVSFSCQMATMDKDYYPVLTEIVSELKAGV